MFEKIYKGVRIFYVEGAWRCYFEDYKEARIKQNRNWSEKSFYDWCDENNLEPVG